MTARDSRALVQTTERTCKQGLPPSVFDDVAHQLYKHIRRHNLNMGREMRRYVAHCRPGIHRYYTVPSRVRWVWLE